MHQFRHVIKRAVVIVFGERGLQSARRVASRVRQRDTINVTSNYNDTLVAANFDAGWYRRRYSDVLPEADPLTHYVEIGSQENRFPNPLFDPVWYRARYKDIVQGINPFAHYLEHGSKEGRLPNPLFDPRWYRDKYPDVAKAGIEPLSHYLKYGSREGRWPNPLFDPKWYRSRYRDVVDAGVEPLVHFLSSGAGEGRMPIPEFDTAYYRRNYAHLIREQNPLAHFLQSGPTCDFDPNENFCSRWYKTTHMKPADNRIPLVHYVHEGKMVGRTTSFPSWVKREWIYQPARGEIPWVDPLNILLTERLPPTINVLLPSLEPEHMSGGPLTAIHLAAKLADSGSRVRLVSTGIPIKDFTVTRDCLEKVASWTGDFEIADASERGHPTEMGPDDMFLATAWWTAQMVRFLLPRFVHQKFFYLIQDFEPLLHAASPMYAMALSTYSWENYIPIFNTHILADFFREAKVGRFADKSFADSAIVFEPAVDSKHFYRENRESGADKSRYRLTFYGRPSSGLRNLYELGLAALRRAVEKGALKRDRWEVRSVGDKTKSVDLGGTTLEPTPWMDFSEYAHFLRQTDVAVALMEAPHPSYLPVEAAACGAMSVTTTFGSKTKERLTALSPYIHAVDADVEAIANKIAEVVQLVEKGVTNDIPTAWPGDWNASFDPVMNAVIESRDEWLHLVSQIGVSYDSTRFRMVEQRRKELAEVVQVDGLLSFITSVWNTDAQYLKELSDCILGQDGGTHFEWLVLDNGSTARETCQALEELAQHPCVRLHRVEENLGIIGAMRFLLQRASGRYVMPLDSDDLVTPDCVRVVTRYLTEHSYPALMYTDEDKILDSVYRDPYCKPDWDPVLFINSAYIAHLGVIDRELALELGAYDDPAAEGCHDWDTFIRFMVKGYQPVHVPEIVYTWRMHTGSTAGNINSKSFIHDSHRSVLTKFLAARGLPFDVELSPLFKGAPDWRFQRREAPLPAVVTVVIRKTVPEESAASAQPATNDMAVIVDCHDVKGFQDACSKAKSRNALLHIRWDDIEPLTDTWLEEAVGIMEVFPDTVMVGGPVEGSNRTLVDGGRYLGFGSGLDCPDVGRLRGDPGYFAQQWKMRSVDGVAVDHCIVRPEIAESASREYQVGAGLIAEAIALVAAASQLRIVASPFLRAKRNNATYRTVPGRHRLLAHAGSKLRASGLLSPHLGREIATAYAIRPRSETKGLEASFVVQSQFGQAYPAFSTASQDVQEAGLPSASILTTVYKGVLPEHLSALADTIQIQTFKAEWIIVADLAAPDALEATIEEIGRTGATVVRVNKGTPLLEKIRLALQQATGEYVLSVDADDLLVPEAIACMMSEAAAADRPAWLYSDEAVLAENGETYPYRRPDWDPVLNLTSSYIWHLTAIRRDVAIDAEIYTDAGANWCHDWDTAFRLSDRGHNPVHVRTVLYLWRQHKQSSTNSDAPVSGSLVSQRHVLQNFLVNAGLGNDCIVMTSPIWRGAPELSVELKRFDSVDAVYSFWAPAASKPMPQPALFWKKAAGILEPAAIKRLSLAHPVAELLEAVVGDHEFIAVLDERCVPLEIPGWIEDAVRLLKIHSDAALATGGLLDLCGSVIWGTGCFGPRGLPSDPLLTPDKTPLTGPFAIAAKAHSCHFPCPLNFVARTEALVRILKHIERDLSLTALSWRIGVEAARNGLRVIYSPRMWAAVPKTRSELLARASEYEMFAERYSPECTNRVAGATGFVCDNDWREYANHQSMGATDWLTKR